MNVRNLVRKVPGPTSTHYCCPYCSFMERVRKGQKGVGRGAGYANASKAHAAVVKHIKTAHADRLTSVS